MKAYAILAGGGVKGAALAGSLLAAEELDIDFLGYGGTSAGSIVALLATVGYTANDIRRIMVTEINFDEFLDDGGIALAEARKGWDAVSHCLHNPVDIWKNWITLSQSLRMVKILTKDLGLYHGDKLRIFLRQKIVEKIPRFADQQTITFRDLENAGCKPLKIVASNVRLSRSVVFSGAGNHDIDGDVVEAVRASISFPFVFKPVRQSSNYLVDGGLCSNLPVFLFEDERRKANFSMPVVAFDLVPGYSLPPDKYTFSSFIRDMLFTSLGASDKLLRNAIEGIYYVPIEVPEDIDTLDFKLSIGRREELFRLGHSITHSKIRKQVPQWAGARTSVERLQALRGDPKLINFLLGVMAKSFEAETQAKNIRTNIMLPLDETSRVVVYQHGMDLDPDCDLELSLNGGCSGLAWKTRRPSYADLVEAKSSFSKWEMTQVEQNKVRQDRKTMLSIPIFALTSLASGEKKKVDDFPLLGTLSLDTETNLLDTGWIQDGSIRYKTLSQIKYWADIFGKLLTEREIFS